MKKAIAHIGFAVSNMKAIAKSNPANAQKQKLRELNKNQPN
jgi:hypothetical protein